MPHDLIFKYDFQLNVSYFVSRSSSQSVFIWLSSGLLVSGVVFVGEQEKENTFI